jgi:hypothetical protein
VRQARQLIVAARRCLQDIVIGSGKYLDRVVGLLSARERRPQNRDNLLNWVELSNSPQIAKTEPSNLSQNGTLFFVGSNPRRMCVRRNALPSPAGIYLGKLSAEEQYLGRIVNPQ